jgi:hypothetical protein
MIDWVDANEHHLPALAAKLAAAGVAKI